MKKKQKSKTITIHRDARTGHFVTKQETKKRPSTTVTEKRKRKC